jgi:hypothetical protein
MSRRYSRAVALGLMTILCTGCLTLRTQRPYYINLERNTIMRTPSEDTLLFEAQAAGHVFLHDGLPAAFSTIVSDPAHAQATAWRVIFSPIFRLRQLNDSSAAVRTPSFMPRLMIERDWAHRSPRSVGSEPVEYGRIRIHTLQAGIQHHSNGQAGCFRQGFRERDAHVSECVAVPGADTSVIRLNRANGDFSTTLIVVNYTFTTARTQHSDEIPSYQYSLTAGYEHHPSFLFGSMSPEQRELYKPHRGRLKADYELAVGTFHPRLAAEYEIAPRVEERLQARMEQRILNYRWAVDASVSSDRLLGAGLFVRYNDGQDYYNIGFVSRRRVFSVGVLLDVGGRRIGLTPVGER